MDHGLLPIVGTEMSSCPRGGDDNVGLVVKQQPATQETSEQQLFVVVNSGWTADDDVTAVCPRLLRDTVCFCVKSL